MNELINHYLLQHRSVSIPGLGTIYVERIPAQSDYINKRLLPPAYHYRFDKYFDAPEKEFFSFLAARKKVNEQEAMQQYNEWARDLRSQLSIGQPTVIEGVGSLRRESSGGIQFEPVGALKTYDSIVPAERVIRTNARHSMIVGDKETTTAEMSGYLQGVHREKASWWIYALIIAAIALVAIFFHYFRNGTGAPFGNHQTIETK